MKVKKIVEKFKKKVNDQYMKLMNIYIEYVFYIYNCKLKGIVFSFA